MNKKILVINNDNDLLHKYYIENKDSDVELHTFGIENDSEVMAKDIVLKEQFSEFLCNIDGENYKITVPVGGIHFVYNALCALTVGRLLGLSMEEIKKGIEGFELTKKRMDITKLENGVTIINDSYNASFESMKASLKYLSTIDAERKIAVLGDMFELGNFSEVLHKKVGEEVAKNNIDMLLCCGENSKHIIEEALKNGMNTKDTHYFVTKEEMKEFIKNNWKKNDAFLFKASNGMKFFEIVEDLVK